MHLWCTGTKKGKWLGGRSSKGGTYSIEAVKRHLGQRDLRIASVAGTQ